MGFSNFLRVVFVVSSLLLPILPGQNPAAVFGPQTSIHPIPRDASHSSNFDPSVLALSQFEPPAHGIILFIGDGMGQYHRAAARMLSQPENSQLTMDTLAIDGWSRTGSANSAITDSAAGGTAISTGEKTNNGMVGVAPDGTWLRTILESARAKGLSTGLITTTQITHATPATFGAHVPSRSMMNEIAEQYLDAEIDILLGGGEDEFLPTTESGCYPEPGEREDGRNLISEAIAAGYSYLCTPAEFTALDPGSTDKVLGLFADEGFLPPYAPTLTNMTNMAIDVLSQDPEGYLLMVEAGQIDWASHQNNASLMMERTLALDQAISAALTHPATQSSTIIILGADHETGGLSISADPTGLPSEDGPFYSPEGTPFYLQWQTDYHTAADVPISAQGPFADLLSGLHENTDLYQTMYIALTGITFPDMPSSHWAWEEVEALVREHITVGFPDGTYRPAGLVNRAQIAVFLLKSIHGTTYTPPTADGSHPFSDISGHWAEAWIEQLYDEGISAGFPDSTYRPGDNINRAQMAVMLLVAKHGSGYTPPALDGSNPFSDISGPWAEGWIEQLYDDGITAGYPDGTYRPADNVNRAQIAVFLVATFGITVY